MAETAVLSPAPVDDRRAVLTAFDRGLLRESHVLREHPEILWQQMFNRLQWATRPHPDVLATALLARSGPGADPWIRTRTPFRESGALVTHGSACGVVITDLEGEQR